MDDMQMRTWAEVDLSDLEHNYRALRGLLPRDCRFLGVVKANAYGHGAVPVAKRLEALGAEYLAVACLEEAGELEQVDAIHLADVSTLTMDYGGRFTVRLPYDADYPRKLRMLRQSLDSGAIQDNMTGTFDMRSDNGEVHFIPRGR